MGDIYREKIKNICIKVENNKFYKKLLKNPWPYFVGATLIAIINILLLKLTNIPLRVSSWFTFLGAGFLENLGFEIANLTYFGERHGNFSDATSFFNTYYTFLNTGIILGAFIASLWASQ
ncbi:MAG: YeeE/YedE thiosulfate transporter family protein, partial [Peptostreptococcaceae bacterium]